MNLYKLLEGLSYESSLPDMEITGVTCDNRQVEKGNLFVCMRGVRTDGHDYAEAAIKAGAAAVLAERDTGLPSQVLVEDTREAYAVLCANLFDNPQKKLKLIGVTGTNGKTTITYLMKHILEGCGCKVGLIGTIQNQIGDMTFPAKYTTPDPYILMTIFSRMVDAGAEYAVMETSSHGLDQKRVAGCHFAAGIFTNLTQDHLDYHGNMENYYQAKRSLFNQVDMAIINIDDAYGRRLASEVKAKTYTFSTSEDAANYTAKTIKSFATGSTFAFVGSGIISRVRIAMPGEFSVSNAMAAISCSLALGFPLEQVINAISSCSGVTGRFEVIKTPTDYTVIRDYAHTPDGLEKVLTAIKTFAPAKVITLFGCAGNRDRGKRKLMAEVVSRLSDFAILTSDNPRNEDPLQIIEDAKLGLFEHKTPYEIIPDRYEAIKWGLAHAAKDDILLLAGKGHEDYQVLNFGTIYFDEKVIVEKILGMK